MEQKNSRPVGVILTLACCIAGTVGILAAFSVPGHHENTDALFKSLIDFFVGLWNTMPWGIVMLAGALVFPILGLLLSRWDRLTRKIPSGEFLYDRVGLSFERRAGLRFIPSFLMMLYLIIAAFMQGADSSVGFDPPGYFPFGQNYSAGEWLNFIFVTLVVFSLLLIIAEGVISAGPVGALLHISMILIANVYLTMLMVGIMFVCVSLLGFIGKVIMAVIAAVFCGALTAIKPKTEIRYIEK